MGAVILVIECIPYKTFREKIRIVAEYAGKAKVEVYEDYIYIEKIEEVA